MQKHRFPLVRNNSLRVPAYSVIIISALLMYFGVIIDDLNVYLLMLDCESSVSQWLTKY